MARGLRAGRLWARRIILAAVAGLACAAAPRAPADSLGEGRISFYGERFRGRLTASGEPFDPDALTAAHRRLKFGTCVRVANLENGRVVEVRINDRGPFIEGRILDVSLGAARELGMVDRGVVRARLTRC